MLSFIRNIMVKCLMLLFRFQPQLRKLIGRRLHGQMKNLTLCKYNQEVFDLFVKKFSYEATRDAMWNVL